MTECTKDTVKRPEGEIRIVSPIDSRYIMTLEDAEDEYYYKYQEWYALALWAMQEKFGLTFEEATYRCCELFRLCKSSAFMEKTFGMDFHVCEIWSEYFRKTVPENKLAEYIGEFHPNVVESDVDQWF